MIRRRRRIREPGAIYRMDDSDHRRFADGTGVWRLRRKQRSYGRCGGNFGGGEGRYKAKVVSVVNSPSGWAVTASSEPTARPGQQRTGKLRGGGCRRAGSRAKLRRHDGPMAIDRKKRIEKGKIAGEGFRER